MSGALAEARLLWRAVGYEFRKRVQFRTGFVVRELLNGLVEPLVMLFVYMALYRSALAAREDGDELGAVELGGWSYDEIVRYVAGLIVVRKLIFGNRGLEVADEIFQGRITKYFVMPFRYFTLSQARFVQASLLQVVVAALAWVVGYGLFGERWLVPVSATSVLQAGTLVLLGSYCAFLLYFIINALAFWLDVIWSLLVMAAFVISFTGGAVLPVSQMPEGFAAVFGVFFPYWMITAPIELLLGRLGTDAFLHGLGMLGLQLVLLEWLRRVVWRRGLAHYVGAGM